MFRKVVFLLGVSCLVPAVVGGQVLFEDDFSRDLSRWDDAAALQGWEIRDGALARPDPNAGGALELGDDSWRDYVVEFRLMRTEVLEGGHNGFHLRRGKDRRCHIFLRPQGLRYEMPPVTETSFTVREHPFETGRWYSFRIIVKGRDAEVEVDDIYQGTVRGLNNPTGGIAFVAYRVALRLDDVRVTALTRPVEAAAPPEPPTLLDPTRLDRKVPLTVINTSPLPRPAWPILCRASDLGLPPEASLTSLTAFTPQGAPLPSQLDDTDLSGDATAGDEFCFALDVPPTSATPVEVRFTTGRARYARQGQPAVAAEQGAITGRDYAVVWSTRDEDGKALNSDAQYRLGTREGPVFFSMKAWDDEETAWVSAGPVRAVWASRAPLAANGVLTRRIECYPGFLRMVARLAPEPGLSSAAIRAPHWGGAGAWAFQWFTPMLGQVHTLRWQDTLGYHEDSGGGFDQVWFPAAGRGIHMGMELSDGAIALVRRTAQDYDPGAMLVGRHAYYAAHIHFGWRQPILVWADAPNVTSLTVARTDGGAQAFRAAQASFGQDPLILSAQAGPRWVADQARLVDSLRRAAAALGVTAALDGFPGPPQSLAEAVRIRAALESLDLEALIASADKARLDRLQVLARAQGETTPSQALLRRLQPVLTAARWDWNVGRHERALERLAWAADLWSKAADVGGRAPGRRLVADAKPGPIVPYVTIAGQASQEMSDLGLTVSHDWLPWAGDLDPDVETAPGEYDWRRVDDMVQAVNETGMWSLPLIDFNPPKWWRDKYEGFGLHELVDPGILGREPEALQAFGRWIDAASTRFERAERILCWSVRNEPSYLPGGQVTSPLMLEAMRRWLAAKYGDIARLNEVWGTDYAGFDDVPSPRRRDQEPAAWYDLVMFKAEAIAGELGWEADRIQRNSRVKRTGAKYVVPILSTGGVRAGMGPDPWTGAAPQRGVALCDLYTDGDWETYRLASELWFAAGGSPVISAETGLQSRPPQRRHRWVRWPDERQRSFAWSALQFGLFGVQYWSWCGSEEYGAINWDGTVPDDVIWSVMANQERLALGPLLSSLRPVARIGYYYPQATLIDAVDTEEAPAKYAQLYHTLSDAGYQLRNFSFRDVDDALGEVGAVVLPPAPYVEAEVVPKLRQWVRGGGKLLAVTAPAVYDEHLRPLNAGKSALADVLAEPDRDGETTFREFGEGRAALIPRPMGLSFGRARTVVNLRTKWRFKLGLTWPQRGWSATEQPPGAEDPGGAEHWESPDHDDSSWTEVAVPGAWEDRGFPDVDGYGWYRLSFDLPVDLAGRRLLLKADTLDDQGWIYVNGRLVAETSSWEDSVEEDVSAYLKPGARNLIALRVLDTGFRGGLRGELSLTSPDLPDADRQILQEVLARLGFVPEAACAASGVVRRLMVDSAGDQHLLYTNETANALKAHVTVPLALNPGRGELLNLLEGQRYAYEVRDGATVVELDLAPHEIGVLPLKPLP